MLSSIVEEFEGQYYDLKGIEKAVVISTTPLNDTLRKKFKDVVANATGKKVELEEKIDKNLIGGYILRVGDKQIDESLSSKLRNIELEFNS